MRLFTLLLLFAALLHATEWHKSYTEAKAAASKSAQPILALFMREGCPHCDRLEQESLAHPAIQRAIKEGYTPLWIDTTQNPQAARQMGLNIRGVPTAVILEEGRTPRQMVGYRDPMGMMGFLQR